MTNKKTNSLQLDININIRKVNIESFNFITVYISAVCYAIYTAV